MSTTETRTPTIAYFGATFAAPIYERAQKIFTPHSQSCLYCGEPIAAEDNGFRVPSIIDGGTRRYEFEHRECHMVQAIDTDWRPDARLTVRQNALLACLHFYVVATGDATNYYRLREDEPPA